MPFCHGSGFLGRCKSRQHESKALQCRHRRKYTMGGTHQRSARWAVFRVGADWARLIWFLQLPQDVPHAPLLATMLAAIWLHQQPLWPAPAILCSNTAASSPKSACVWLCCKQSRAEVSERKASSQWCTLLTGSPVLHLTCRKSSM